jgi:hypothetical protein
MTRVLFQHQDEAAGFLSGDEGTLLIGGMGTGKCQDLDSLLLTPFGWIRMGDAQVGFPIMGADGKTYTITGVYPQGMKDAYQVEFGDGTRTICCLDHLWRVRRMNGHGSSRPVPQWETKTLAQIMAAGITKRARALAVWQVPMPAAMDWPALNPVISPYAVGALLGDGGLTGNSVMLSTPDHKKAIAERVLAGLPEGIVAAYSQPVGQCGRTAFVSPDARSTGNRDHVLWRALEAIGMRGVLSKDRRIPAAHLWGSISERQALLQGLMDTDGSTRSGRTMFCTTSRGLADDVADLVRSLGGMAILRGQPRNDGKPTVFEVNVRMGDWCPFSLPYHMSRWRPNRAPNLPRKTLKSVTKLDGQRPMQCISVSAPDQLYVTDGYIVTHNTASAIEAMHRRWDKFGAILCPAIATSNWVREFALSGSPLNVVDAKRHPKKVRDADVLVISQDSIRTPAMQALVYDRPLDTLIVDEAHGFADPLSQRTAAAYSQRLLAEKVMLLTGTPTPRHAAQLWTHVKRTAPQRLDDMTYDQFADRYCKVVVKRVGNKRQAERVIMGNKPAMMDDLRERLSGWWLRQRKEDVLKNLPPKTYMEIDLLPSRADLKAMQDEIEPEIFEAIEFAVQIGDVRGLSMMSDQVSTLRRLLAKAKVAPAVEYVTGLAESSSEALPISIWGWHTEPLHMMKAQLLAKGYTVGLIDGGTGQAERERIIDGFQAGEIDFFIGQIMAAGISVTLTRGWRAVFLEESFNPSNNEQAADRHHRIGQLNHVQVDRLILVGTIDEAVAAICARRESDFEHLTEGV